MTTDVVVVAPSSSAVAQRLAEWSNAARGAFAPNTERAYKADAAAFSAWCAAAGLAALPASPVTIASFLRAESDAARAVATLRRRIATIARMHRAAGLTNPCAEEPVRLAMRAIVRERGTQQRQAAPLVARDAHRISDRVLGDDARLRDVRDVAMMLVGRDLLARASELVALDVSDIEFDADGALVALRRRKTSTEATPCQVGPDATTALRQWLDRAQIQAGPVFRSVTKGGSVTERALSPRDVGRIIKGLATRAKFEPARVRALSGHSLRVGMAVDLVAVNVDSAAIMQAAGWTTARMLARYTAKLNAKRGAIARFYHMHAG